MSTTQITFTPAQISYLRDWFNQQSSQYVNTVMEDDFEADEENFGRLCGSTFNVDGFKVGEMVGMERESDVSARNTNRKSRKVKDPNAPKRGKSAYMCWLWSDDGVTKVKSEDGDLAHKMAVKKASEVWKAMTDEQKAPWVQQSETSKKEYEAKMKDYAATGSSGEEQDDNVECPEGWECRGRMYLAGYSSAGKKRYDTLEGAIADMDGVADAGGVVYDGKSYTIRKTGNMKVSGKGEMLYTRSE